MDKKEIDFAAKLKATFKIEAEEHLLALSKGLTTLEQGTNEADRKQIVETVFREAHSLKGAARSVNELTIQTICQAFENVLSAWKQGIWQPVKSDFNVLYETLDLVGKALSLPPGQFLDKDIVKEMIHKLDVLLEKKSQQLPVETAVEPQPVSEQKSGVYQPPVEISHAGIEPAKTIRVSQTKLDHLFQQVEEMVMLKLTAHQQLLNVKQIQEQLALLEKKWAPFHADLQLLQTLASQDYALTLKDRKNLENLVTFFHWQQDFLDKLRHHLKTLVKDSAQDDHLAGGTVETLLEDTKKVLMQPVSTLFEVLPRMTRDLAQSLHKEVRLEFQGESIEVDRRILEEMKDPFIHLIRNSIDHGIESPEERSKAHKPPTGVIKISVSQTSGNYVEFLIIDDGRGINVNKVKESAVKQGLISSQEAAVLTDHETMALIFQSGVSTSSLITELSGRGLGMGIVAEKVENLGGHIYVESTPGIGTTIKIQLPTTLATFRGIFIQIAGHDFIFPTHQVQRVVRIKRTDIKTVENNPTVNIEGRIIPLTHLADVLNLPIDIEKKKQEELFLVVVIKIGDKSRAFIVDSVWNEQEVLMKGIGKKLGQIPNILAATITESGKIIPILNPADLIKSPLKSQHIEPLTASEMKPKVILIAEDSPTSRIMLKNILETSGYQVIAAGDGAEALSLFSKGSIDLLISDLEMPRMNGLTLTREIRSTEQGKQLPIILLSSLASPEDQKKGAEAGANAYLDKNNFTQTKLLDVIHRLL